MKDKMNREFVQKQTETRQQCANEMPNEADKIYTVQKQKLVCLTLNKTVCV